MKICHLIRACLLSAILVAMTYGCLNAAEIERPEEIRSKRITIYDDSTYVELARKWKAYYDAYPSEYAYANWMYAARYAEDKDYERLLKKGLKKYKANPTLLYLESMSKYWAGDNSESIRLLERSAALDRENPDPWFMLVILYMNEGEDEQRDVALRHLLESGGIQDEVMDFCYNILISLDKNAIIITNGDNDTYPIWVLQNILKIRDDVTIINRSLLNSDWYPLYVIEHGAPRFTSKDDLETLRETIMTEIRRNKNASPSVGLFSDTLITMIIDSAKRADRPVYFSKTLYITDSLRPLMEKGRDLGLVTLATPTEVPYGKQLHEVYRTWIDSFRTGGLHSWRLRYSSEGDAGRQLMTNYAMASIRNLDSLKIHAPRLRAELFKWYLQYADNFVPGKYRDDVYKAWCEQSDVEDIRNWCRQKGIKP